MPKEMRCSCGKIAFVRDVINNPTPDNPTPCRIHFLEIIKLRNEKMLSKELEYED